MEVEKELKSDNQFFEKNREKLIERYGLGKYITIYNKNIVSVGESYGESAMKAYEIIGAKPCITRKCVPPEQEVYELL